MTRPRVAFLDHTADIGYETRADTAGDLFDAAGRGMLALLRGEEDDGIERRDGSATGPTRPLALTAPDPPRLLADFLRELLFLHELEALDYVAARFDRLDLEQRPCTLEARVAVDRGGHAVREIKGVTYHEIEVRPCENGTWQARVIFDV